MRILMIHTGKTAGSSLIDVLSHANLNWTLVHAGLGLGPAADTIEAIVEHYDMYIIPTREPTARTISAFNWMHLDGGGDWDQAGFAGPSRPATTIRQDWLAAQVELWKNESILGALSECFPELPGGANAFAESLGSEGNCSDIARRALLDSDSGSGHIAKGFAWYLLSKSRGVEAVDDRIVDQMRKPGKHVFHVSQARPSPCRPRR